MIALALVLAFNAGAKAAPSDEDCSLGAPAADSFGARMAKARAAKHKGDGAKTRKSRKGHSAKIPKAPRVPKVPTEADGF